MSTHIARTMTMRRSSLSALSTARAVVSAPITGSERIPSHTSRIGADSSRIAASWRSIVPSFSSSYCFDRVSPLIA